MLPFGKTVGPRRGANPYLKPCGSTGCGEWELVGSLRGPKLARLWLFRTPKRKPQSGGSSYRTIANVILGKQPFTRLYFLLLYNVQLGGACILYLEA